MIPKRVRSSTAQTSSTHMFIYLVVLPLMTLSAFQLCQRASGTMAANDEEKILAWSDGGLTCIAVEALRKTTNFGHHSRSLSSDTSREILLFQSACWVSRGFECRQGIAELAWVLLSLVDWPRSPVCAVTSKLDEPQINCGTRPSSHEKLSLLSWGKTAGARNWSRIFFEFQYTWILH